MAAVIVLIGTVWFIKADSLTLGQIRYLN